MEWICAKCRRAVVADVDALPESRLCPSCAKNAAAADLDQPLYWARLKRALGKRKELKDTLDLARAVDPDVLQKQR